MDDQVGAFYEKFGRGGKLRLFVENFVSGASPRTYVRHISPRPAARNGKNWQKKVFSRPYNVEFSKLMEKLRAATVENSTVASPF